MKSSFKINFIKAVTGCYGDGSDASLFQIGAKSKRSAFCGNGTGRYCTHAAFVYPKCTNSWTSWQTQVNWYAMEETYHGRTDGPPHAVPTGMTLEHGVNFTFTRDGSHNQINDTWNGLNGVSPFQSTLVAETAWPDKGLKLNS